MITVLTIDNEFESAKRLGYETETEYSYAQDYADYIVVRWGNSGEVYDKRQDGTTYLSEFPRVINPMSAIKQNIKKDVTLGKLSEVVNTPKIWTAGSQVPDQQVVVYRPISHCGGSNFRVTTGPFEVAGGYYATSWIRSKTEYRVWFCGDQTMCGTRYKRTPCTDKYPCRSMWGYKFEKKVPAVLHKATLAAANTIGLECGAADVMKYRDNFYFLELNSAATIDKQVIEDFYKNGLKRLIGTKYPMFTF